ncbi:hypothetical protein OH77DRAFT_1576588 [Trametes cingulata]|nr:hypothetical protein OH77DRAFT_1576588 [Trametes cingulata]
MYVLGLGSEALEALAEMWGETPPPPMEQDAIEYLTGDQADEDEWEDVESEPEDEAITYAIRDVMAAYTGVHYRGDERTWRERVDNTAKNWAPVLLKLVDAYVSWPLALVGYLGNAPLNPSLAISFKTLELLRCLKLVKASFSIEAFTKLLCHQYYIPYRPLYRTAISEAFDVYLTIQHLVSKRVMSILGRDAPDWRARNSCPACSYEVEGETPAAFSRIIALDGNNSLKRLATSGKRSTADKREFDSDYFLPHEFADRYANDVKSRRRGTQPKAPLVPHTTDDNGSEDEPDESDEEESRGGGEGGDPTDSNVEISSCAKNWKAAAADEKKHMWGVFEETGIFASACRHGIILWVVDMVRSGEKAKYPLAIVGKAHDVLGERLLFGYDIGCDFLITVRNSSLGVAAAALGTHFCVNAFYGYSHSYDCQVAFHPNGIVGIGLEDLEVLERIFSSSNQLAPVIRYASKYHRKMLIDLFYRQWDHEKYGNLSLMFFNNFEQATEILRAQVPALERALTALNLTMEDLERFHVEERDFFLNLKDEDDCNVHAITYVEALQELRSVQLSWSDPRTGPMDYNADLSITRKLETRRRYLRERVRQVTAEVTAMEVALNIMNRWQPEDLAYRETLQYIAERKYHRALGKLQRLVIQRLFELHKMNLAQTGYHMRTYIAKNLQRRCKAIRQAVKEYNAAAALLNPPREALDWSKASHYTFLEQFTLLRDTQNDLRDRPWAQPAVREVMRSARRVARAREEIENVNREARRVHTHIRDEEVLFVKTLAELKQRGDPLHGAVTEYARHRRAANARILAYLHHMFAHEGFTGDPTPGVRARGTSANPPLHDLPHPTNGILAREEMDEIGASEEDNVHHEVTGIIEFLAKLRT